MYPPPPPPPPPLIVGDGAGERFCGDRRPLHQHCVSLYRLHYRGNIVVALIGKAEGCGGDRPAQNSITLITAPVIKRNKLYNDGCFDVDGRAHSVGGRRALLTHGRLAWWQVVALVIALAAGSCCSTSSASVCANARSGAPDLVVRLANLH